MAKRSQVMSEESPGMGELLGMDPTGRDDRIAELEDLIQFVARVIVTRNANGRQSDKFCALCQKSKLHKEPCRHADIWRLAGIDK